MKIPSLEEYRFQNLPHCSQMADLSLMMDGLSLSAQVHLTAGLCFKTELSPDLEHKRECCYSYIWASLEYSWVPDSIRFEIDSHTLRILPILES